MPTSIQRVGNMFVDHVEYVRARVPELNQAIEEQVLRIKAGRAAKSAPPEKHVARPPKRLRHTARNTA